MFIYTTQIFEENVENFMVYGSYAAILLRFSKKSFSNSTARFCRFVDNEYYGLNTNQFLHYSTQSCCRSTEKDVISTVFYLRVFQPVTDRSYPGKRHALI